MMHPILDKYYERDPYHVRSSAFVQAKGLASNEKAPTSGSLSPPAETGSGKLHGQANGGRGLSPDVVRRSSLLSSSLLREATAVPQSAPSSATSSLLPLRLSPAKANVEVKSTLAHQVDGLSPKQASSPEESLCGHGQVTAGVQNPKKAQHFFPELALGMEAS